MKIAYIRFILVLAVILAATVLASSCGNNVNNGDNSVLFQQTITRDNETVTYLKAMQAWQTKWNDKNWRYSIEDKWTLIG